MPDPITPILPDPQASVDAALGTLDTSSPAVPSTPVVEPPKPEVLPVQPTTPTPAMSAPMGDETPLAFATPTLNAMPTQSTPKPEATPTPVPAMPVVPVAPIMPESPKLEPMPSVGSSYLPPVPPAPISIPPAEDKPKKKSKTMLVVIGIFALFGTLLTAGYMAYSSLVPIEKNIIAGVFVDGLSQAECDGPWNGGWLKWIGGACKVTGNSTPGSATQTENPNVETTLNNEASCKGGGYVWCSSIDSNNTPYSFCNATGVNGDAIKTCNQLAVEKGFTITYGSTPSTVADATHKYKCVCGSGTFYFDKSGICNSTAVTTDPSGSSTDPNFDVSKTVDPAYYNKWGLCGIVDNKDPNTGNVANIADYGSCFTCTNKNCSITGTAEACKKCTTIRYECGKQVTGNSCTKNPDPSSTSSTSIGKCGTVEQIDVMCDGHYVNSRTVLNGACESTPADNPVTHKACNVTTKVCETVTGAGADTCSTDANCAPAAPVLACTGLTQTPATTPVIGDKLTFTCAGTITPTAAATLSYKFKYSLDDGADQLLTNKTNTTAELTINACGTYSVQCKVCATIAGVLKCDPTWTGAIQ